MIFKFTLPDSRQAAIVVLAAMDQEPRSAAEIGFRCKMSGTRVSRVLEAFPTGGAIKRGYRKARDGRTMYVWSKT